MGGDTAAFHALWVTASTPVNSSAPPPRIAGRRAELDVVRRHLESGSGLLLVMGEAGIGKTALVTSAADTSGTHVAVGHCLPLSAQVPLLPFADALRRLLDVENGRWVREALAVCPPYVEASLAPLLPGLDVGADRASTDDYARHRMFTAAASLLEALAQARPVGVLFEDLHWADGPTLDLLEHVVAGRTTIPVVGTWRTEDDGTSAEILEWLERVRRHPDVVQLQIPPLSREETAEQLAMLGGRPNPDQVARIHARSEGRPLFTEHLAAHLDDDRVLPQQLFELLDRRLSGLEGDAWAIVRLLGVAARPLTSAQLEQASGLPRDRLISELHELHQRRLVRSGTADTVEMQHPLLAEATQRRLVPGEGVGVHRLLATVLGSGVTTSPAEVATHWQLAGEPTQEAEWRIAAAYDSAARFDWTQEAEHWLRTLELWPNDGQLIGNPPLSRATVYVSAMDALNESLQWDRAAALSDRAEAQLPGIDEAARAELLRRAAEYRGEREGLAIGLELVEQALEIYRRLPLGSGVLRAMNLKRQQLNNVGRFDEAGDLARSALDTAMLIGDRRAERHQLNSLAWYVGVDGRVSDARALLARGRALFDEGADPLGDLREAVITSDLLLVCGHDLAEIEEASSVGLEAAKQWGMDNVLAMMLHGNIATAQIRAGHVSRGAALVTVHPAAPWDAEHWPLHSVRIRVEALSGELDAAVQRIEMTWDEVVAEGEIELEVLCVAADVYFWHGSGDVALDRLVHALTAVVDSAPVRIVCPAVLALARAAAERTGQSASASALHLEAWRDLCARVRLDSTAHAGDEYVAAHALASVAEFARADGTATTDHWARAAAAWDSLARPHDAAYCRWRAAQVRAAGRTGHGRGPAAEAGCARREGARAAQPGDRQDRGRRLISRPGAAPPRRAGSPSTTPSSRPTASRSGRTPAPAGRPRGSRRSARVPTGRGRSPANVARPAGRSSRAGRRGSAPG